MKSSGVVRRVDDLGRIVIPKEIRQTLRIRDGESLEIFVDREMIALKKFSKMSDMDDLSKQLVDIINAAINKTVLVTDRDKFIAGAGPLKKKYFETNISHYLEGVMRDRENIVFNNVQNISLVEGDIEKLAAIIFPIIMNVDVMGFVIVLSEKSDIGQLEEKMATVAAQFLGKHIEE